MKSSDRKTWVLRFRVKDRENFIGLRDGIKSIETRAATERYMKVNKGDILKIVCGKELVEKKVKQVRWFKSLDAMFKVIPYRKIMPDEPNLTVAKAVYAGYPGYIEKLKQFGVVAWDI